VRSTADQFCFDTAEISFLSIVSRAKYAHGYWNFFMATDEPQSGQIVGFTRWLLPIMKVEERDGNSTSMTIISPEEARTLEAEGMQMPP